MARDPAGPGVPCLNLVSGVFGKVGVGPDAWVKLVRDYRELFHRAAGTVESLVSRSAYLRTRGGRTYKPSRVEVSIQPTTLKILVHFPNEEPLRVSDEEVEFFADIQLLKCKERFKLSSMTYMGRLEL